MNKPNLSIIDIYPEMIQDAYALSESILDDYGYTNKDFFDYVQQDLEDYGLTNLSNQIVDIFFSITVDLIKQKNPNANVDYYINGAQDTHFYINGEQQ